MYKILIADDEANIRNGLKTALSKDNYEIFTVPDGLSALSVLKKEKIDLIISDIKMPKMDGLTLQDEALKLNPKQLVILLTAYGSVETAVEAMRRGAFDFITKPINLDKLEMLVERAFGTRELKEENKRLKSELKKNRNLENIIGNSKVMQKLFEEIKTVASTKSTVLINGESGTGKELIALAIHKLSARSSEPFIPVHCAALSENLLESELFGHDKGAFTGALTAKDGRFKIADKGTLFLDEIGELSLKIQVKLLRVIQEKTFEKVGSSSPISVDVRFIAATNTSLEKMVEEGKFREDLYFRINVVRIDVPPLRKRKSDIPLLVDHFLKETCQELNKKKKTLSDGAMRILNGYKWPGNVRELRNIVEHMVVFSKNNVIDENEIPSHIIHPAITPKNSVNIAENEKMLIQKALNECKYNKTAAAEKLGMSRRTIHRKIKEYNIEA